jgi:hypothetical protein
MLYGLDFVSSKNVDTLDVVFFSVVESLESCMDKRRSCKLFSYNKESNFVNTVNDVFIRT